MKLLSILISGTALCAASLAYAQYQPDHNVNGYFKKDGTYVQPHHATNPDGTTHNNYSHQGNYNPYTGKQGHRNDGY